MRDHLSEAELSEIESRADPSADVPALLREVRRLRARETELQADNTRLLLERRAAAQAMAEAAVAGGAGGHPGYRVVLLEVGLRALQAFAATRCADVFYAVDSRSMGDYVTCLAEELGEVARLVHRIRDAEHYGPKHTLEQHRAHLGEELADMLTYVALLAERAGVQLPEAFVAKFDQVSERAGWSVRLRSLWRVAVGIETVAP